jgi:hypothetical protein
LYNAELEKKNSDDPRIEVWDAFVLPIEDLSEDQLISICRNPREASALPDTNWDLIQLSLHHEGDVEMDQYSLYFPVSEKPNGRYLQCFNRYVLLCLLLDMIHATF